MPPAERKEPGRKWAVMLAVLVHLMFAAVLVFGVNWQTREASPVIAELWNSLPPVSAPAPKREPVVEPKPEPRPEPKVEPKPAPKPEPKLEQPKPAKVDIALKEKEKEKKRKEDERKKAEAEKKQREQLKEQERKELLAQVEAEQAELSKQRAAAAETRRQKMAAAAQAAALARGMEDAMGRISSHVRRFVVMPADVAGNPQAIFEVSLLPTGEVLNVKLSRSSGNTAYDNAVERAIHKASPLPLPADPSLVGRFRELKLKFRPNE
ncbi:MAG: energy transducer TonB [Sulfuricella sp.]|nr:energy transducer TonB [Sulfuricella sp.]